MPYAEKEITLKYFAKDEDEKDRLKQALHALINSGADPEKIIKICNKAAKKPSLLDTALAYL